MLYGNCAEHYQMSYLSADFGDSDSDSDGYGHFQNPKSHALGFPDSTPCCHFDIAATRVSSSNEAD